MTSNDYQVLGMLAEHHGFDELYSECCNEMYNKLRVVTSIEQTYDKVYRIHYKFLTQNHMSKDKSARLATIYAVENTWKVYNATNKKS